MGVGSTVRVKRTGLIGVIFQEIDTKRAGASGCNWWVKFPNLAGAGAFFTAELEEV